MPDTGRTWTDPQKDADVPTDDAAPGPPGPRFGAPRDNPGGPQAQFAALTHALAEVTGRLQAETAARERIEAALHQTQRLRLAGHLADGIAHDFNNTLATILGNLELMERCLQGAAFAADPVESERLHRLIERAMEAVQHGAHVTALMQTFSRRQNQGARPTDLNRLITDLTALAGGTLGRSVRVRTALAADLWRILVDPNQLGASLLALCLNARDAMPDGGEIRIVTANARLSAPGWDGLTPGEYVRIAVADTGIGMAEDILARCFEPFFSTKGPAAPGLGLAHVDGVARAAGGIARAASTPGQGTEVVLLLPRAPDGPDGSSQIKQM
jgi:signal transduction histidine kinase